MPEKNEKLTILDAELQTWIDYEPDWIYRLRNEGDTEHVYTINQLREAFRHAFVQGVRYFITKEG